MEDLRVGNIYLDTLFGVILEITKIEGGFVYYTVSKDNYKSEECNLLNEVIEELKDGYKKIQ